MRWAIFGGTFDPIHLGHLRAAEELTGILNLDRVIFVPAAQPPHKTQRTITPFSHREQMVRLAIAGNENFSCSDVENLRAGKSYSVETVQYFLDQCAGKLDLYFIAGQDAFNAITTWREWEKLLLLCNFAVMTRPGYESRGLTNILPASMAARFVYDEKKDGFIGPTGQGIFFRRTTFLEIAASHLRGMIKQGQSIKYLMPDRVGEYIAQNALYRD